MHSPAITGFRARFLHTSVALGCTVPLKCPPVDVIVIGASAGGVEALQGLFTALPANLTSAVLVVLHLGTGHMSTLPEILQRCTTLSVAWAVDDELLQPGHAYIAIADHQMTIELGRVRLRTSPDRGRYRPCIDDLFRSASKSHGARVIGVVLSGMLRDGTDGLKHIADAGGITIAQEPEEAMCGSMPNSAIAGVVDHCLRVRAIGELLERLNARV